MVSEKRLNAIKLDLYLASLNYNFIVIYTLY